MSTRSEYGVPFHTRAGVSLLETLMYVVCLAIVMNVAAQVVLTCTRLSTYGVGVADRYAAAHHLESLFADAVREALAVAPGVARYTTGPTELVLEVVPKGEETRRYVVLGCFTPERLSRLVLTEADGALAAESVETVPLDLTSLSFSLDRESGAARVATMTYRVKTSRGRDVQAEPRHVVAALRSFGSVGP